MSDSSAPLPDTLPMVFKPIAKEFRFKEGYYVQIRREGMVCIYQVFPYHKNNYPLGNRDAHPEYEVVRLYNAKPRKFPNSDVLTEPKETYPGDDMWGHSAFTCVSLQQCETYFQRLLLRGQVKDEEPVEIKFPNGGFTAKEIAALNNMTVAKVMVMVRKELYVAKQIKNKTKKGKKINVYRRKEL